MSKELKPIKLSAVIITLNEGRNIGKCLQSLQGIADEIVVVDSFSKDNTQEVCRLHAVFFHKRKFDGYIGQKNFANDLATGAYILSMDADEVLSSDLQESIRAFKKNPTTDACQMNRLTNYCGQWIRHCGWYPDTKIRIFRKGYAAWGHRNPHERLLLEAGATVHQLDGDLLHYSYFTEAEHWERAEKYARMAAQSSREEGKKTQFLQAHFSAVAAFCKVFFLKKGFLEGRAGWTIARVSAWEKWLKYQP